MPTILAVVRTAVVASFLAAGALAQAGPDGFDHCTALFQSDSKEESAARCFLEVSNRVGHREEASKHLEECLEQDPSLPWVHYYLGRLSQGEAAFGHLREARTLFEAGDDEAAVFRVQSELVKKLDRWELLEEAKRELERAQGMLPAEDKEAVEQFRLLEAMLATSRGDLDDALSQLIGIKERVIPGAPDELREELFFRLHLVYYELGQYREAGENLERSADIIRSLDNRYREAAILYQMATIAAVQPDRQRERVVDLFRHALELAESVGRTDVVASAHLELARLGQDVRFHLDRCLALSEELGPQVRSSCLGALAFELKEKDAKSARKKMDEAIDVARQAGSPWPSVYLWADRMPVSWATVSRQKAIQESLSTLEDIEKLRDSGMDEASSAQYFSVWATAYRWLIGKLLDADDPGYGRESLELAFEVMERHRSRVLFEHLQESGAWAELDQQRQDEVRTYPSGILDQVEQTLRGDEALLAFQLGEWEDNVGRFSGGSWLFAVIHGRTRVYPLDKGDDLASRLEELAGSGQDSDLRRIEELYHEILGPAIGELPSEIVRLLFVPDGRLHDVPFGILRPEGGEPLSNRYEISVLPSAKIWLRWRHQASEPPSGPALVLADPARPPVSPATGDDDARDVVFEPVARGCRELPYAREEGKAILKRLRGSGVLLLGEEASESYLKHQDLGQFGVIHMASHAVVDERNAGRSSVCLAPGSRDEDGDLRIHEIVNLKLDGQLVVLASCDSAAGPTLAGEGVMSLVRAFFLAGARAVVASLASIDDDEARDLFIRFHDHLAAGRTVAQALRATKQEIFADEGESAAYASSAWTHVVLYGDGSLRPLHAGPAAPVHSSWLLWAAAVLVIYLISIGVRIWLRRR